MLRLHRVGLRERPIEMTPTNVPAARTLVDETACARALAKSVGWLRKDRLTKRVVPFVRVGASIRYDMARVYATLVEEGGPNARAAA